MTTRRSAFRLPNAPEMLQKKRATKKTLAYAIKGTTEADNSLENSRDVRNPKTTQKNQLKHINNFASLPTTDETLPKVPVSQRRRKLTAKRQNSKRAQEISEQANRNKRDKQAKQAEPKKHAKDKRNVKFPDLFAADISSDPRTSKYSAEMSQIKKVNDTLLDTAKHVSEHQTVLGDIQTQTDVLKDQQRELVEAIEELRGLSQLQEQVTKLKETRDKENVNDLEAAKFKGSSSTQRDTKKLNQINRPTPLLKQAKVSLHGSTRSTTARYLNIINHVTRNPKVKQKWYDTGYNGEEGTLEKIKNTLTVIAADSTSSQKGKRKIEDETQQFRSQPKPKKVKQTTLLGDVIMDVSKQKYENPRDTDI
ncbi:uncharacterized protein LOC128548107 [Mercenaria mercenaria]|uniref:uncharacterized protein LOC128548107 n=1 Tax=Mercenaria mercenaria TaxID=6596 RepID=UPI00234F9A9B|nr:uncharacterized protein LOC128548107 [Mercenaria mercenaria]